MLIMMVKKNVIIKLKINKHMMNHKQQMYQNMQNVKMIKLYHQKKHHVLMKLMIVQHINADFECTACNIDYLLTTSKDAYL